MTRPRSSTSLPSADEGTSSPTFSRSANRWRSTTRPCRTWHPSSPATRPAPSGHAPGSSSRTPRRFTTSLGGRPCSRSTGSQGGALRITGIRVDGYGLFSGLEIDEIPPGLTVVVGANEAGKSTLLDFLRGVLFGFPDRRSRSAYREPLRGGRHGGAVRLADGEGRRYVVERHLDSHGLEVFGPDGSPLDERRLTALLGGADESLYRSVFAFGLGELAAFESLDRDEIRDLVFSAGVLGAGRSATRAGRALEQRRRRSSGLAARTPSRTVCSDASRSSTPVSARRATPRRATRRCGRTANASSRTRRPHGRSPTRWTSARAPSTRSRSAGHLRGSAGRPRTAPDPATPRRGRAGARSGGDRGPSTRRGRVRSRGTARPLRRPPGPAGRYRGQARHGPDRPRTR